VVKAALRQEVDDFAEPNTGIEIPIGPTIITNASTGVPR
jgi:hypothetical protein